MNILGIEFDYESYKSAQRDMVHQKHDVCKNIMKLMSQFTLKAEYSHPTKREYKIGDYVLEFDSEQLYTIGGEFHVKVFCIYKRRWYEWVERRFFGKIVHRNQHNELLFKFRPREDSDVFLLEQENLEDVMKVVSLMKSELEQRRANYVREAELLNILGNELI